MKQGTSEKLQKGRRLKRLIVFLAALILVFSAVVIVMKMLGQKSTNRAERKEKQEPTPEGSFLSARSTTEGTIFSLNDKYMLKSEFSEKKPPNTFRIFITGGSFAMGDPYIAPGKTRKMHLGIGDWVERELKLRYPSLRFEVINAATWKQNTGRVGEVTKTLATQDADLILVATGNNEKYFPATETNELLQKWILRQTKKKTLLPGVSLEKQFYFSSQDPDTKEVINDFYKTIDRITADCREQNMKLAFATLPINLKYRRRDPRLNGIGAPFPRRDPQIEKGRKLYLTGKYKEAIKAYSESKELVWAARLIAESYEALGKYDLAKKFYKVFTQNNPMNRMRPGFNDYIRQVCTMDNVILVDMEKDIEAQSENGIPDPALFVDYCHMTWWGYEMMARKVVDVLIENKLIPGKPGEPLVRPTEKEMIEKYNLQYVYDLPISRLRKKTSFPNSRPDTESHGF